MDPVYDRGRSGAEIGGGGRRVAGRENRRPPGFDFAGIR